MQKHKRKAGKFKWKKFVSLSLVFSFIMMSLSGIILYLAPPGRVARWSEWLALGFEKDQWEAQHTIFSYTFIILAIFHLFFINWKAFFSYLKIKKHRWKKNTKEILASIVLFGVLFAFTLFQWQPISPVMRLSDYLSSSWEAKGYAPPRPHAEEMSFHQLAKEVLFCDTSVLLQAIEKLGYKANANSNINTLAAQSDKSPKLIFSEIKERVILLQKSTEKL